MAFESATTRLADVDCAVRGDCERGRLVKARDELGVAVGALVARLRRRSAGDGRDSGGALGANVGDNTGNNVLPGKSCARTVKGAGSQGSTQSYD